MMSHEVNNSVGATGSLLHSCLNYRPLLPEEQGRDLEAALRVVITRTEQLGGLMRSFADVVRLPPPQPRPTDLEALLRRVAVLLRAECERRQVAWTWAIEESARHPRPRPRPARAGLRQHRQERPRGHRRLGHAHGPPGPPRPPPLRRHRGHRPRHPPRGPRAPVHALLHDQGHRPGHRPDAHPANPRPAPLRLHPGEPPGRPDPVHGGVSVGERRTEKPPRREGRGATFRRCGWLVPASAERGLDYQWSRSRTETRGRLARSRLRVSLRPPRLGGFSVSVLRGLAAGAVTQRMDWPQVPVRTGCRCCRPRRWGGGSGRWSS